MILRMILLYFNRHVNFRLCIINRLEMKKETVMGNFLIYSIGIMATVFAVSSTLPQILKTLKSKKTDDISIWLSIVLIAGLGLWVAYGVFKNDIVLICGNTVAVLLNSVMLFLKIKYSKNPLN